MKRLIFFLFSIFIFLTNTHLYAEEGYNNHIFSYVQPILPKNSEYFEHFYGYPRLKAIAFEFFYQYEQDSAFNISSTGFNSTIHTNIPSLADNVSFIGAYNGVTSKSHSVGGKFSFRLFPFMRFILSYNHNVTENTLTYTIDTNIEKPSEAYIRKQFSKSFIENSNSILGAIEFTYFHRFSKLFLGYAAFSLGGGATFSSASESALGIFRSDLKVGTWVLFPKNFFLNIYLGVLYKANFGTYSVTTYDRIDYSNDYNPSGNANSRFYLDIELKGKYSQKYVDHFNMAVGISASYADIVTLGLSIGFISQLSVMTYLNVQF